MINVKEINDILFHQYNLRPYWVLGEGLSREFINHNLYDCKNINALECVDVLFIHGRAFSSDLNNIKKLSKNVSERLLVIALGNDSVNNPLTQELNFIEEVIDLDAVIHDFSLTDLNIIETVKRLSREG